MHNSSLHNTFIFDLSITLTNGNASHVNGHKCLFIENDREFPLSGLTNDILKTNDTLIGTTAFSKPVPGCRGYCTHSLNFVHPSFF